MKILPVNNSLNNIKSDKPAFKAYSEIRNVAGYDYYTTSEWFRGDVNLDDLIYTIDMVEFKDAPKVTFICQACSDGEETYSYALKLISTLGEKKAVKKYFPLYGRDIDPINIMRAKEGVYDISEREKRNIEMHGGINLNRYVDFYKDSDGWKVVVKDALKQYVIFKQIDIFDDLKNYCIKDLFLPMKNFMPYLPSKKKAILPEKLYEQLLPSARILLGNFDTSSGIHQIFESKGFVMRDIYGMMRPPNNEERLRNFYKLYKYELLKKELKL